jgi:nucleoside phosphorylase
MCKPQKTEDIPEQSSIVVVAALDVELEYLLDLPYNWSGPKPAKDGVTYRVGHLPNVGIIVSATPNSMGMVETAVITSKLIKTWSPRLIGMIGLCGRAVQRSLNAFV